MRKLSLLICLFLLAFALGCSNDSDVYQDVPLTVKVPENFPPMVYDLSSNPPTQKGFELGRKLFYEGRLASDGVVSCGFCHVQSYAFTHHGHTVSHGVNNAAGKRNAPPIQNLAYQSRFMWDGASDLLDTQPIIPLLSEVEMNGYLPSIMQMLKSDPTYVQLFDQAFPGKPIDAEHMLKALAQFMVMVTSSNSKFDHYRRHETGGDMTAQELNGYGLFQAKYASCHATDLFTDNSFRNNGLTINPAVNDVGYYRVTQNEADKYKFKVPSLRNVEKSGPYMHDGRFLTLEAVLNHYGSGVVNTGTLDPQLIKDGVLGIPLTSQEKTDIIAFLKTLTDNTYLTDPKFAEQ